MRARLARAWRRHPVWTGLSLIVGAVLAAYLGVQAFGALQFHLFAARLEPTLTLNSPAPSSRSSWPFTFRGHTFAIGASVDAARLEAERGIDTTWVFSAAGPLRERFIRHLVVREADSDLVNELTAQTRRLRDDLSLDDDGYLELLVRAVQDIPYDVRDGRVRLPLETVADGRAVCSGKSILLAALLLHEGYDCVFWVLDTQDHVAIGVAAPGPTYRDSGYAWVETTRASYIGQAYPDSLGRGPTTQPPQMIALGGSKSYGAWRQTSFILARLDEGRRAAFALSPYARYADDPTPWRAEYVRLADEYRRSSALTSFIEANNDDRPRVYDDLVRRAAAESGPRHGI
jgi:hypothetical protein